MRGPTKGAMCGAAGAWLPCAETRDSVGVGVGVGLGGSLGFIGFGRAAVAGGGLVTAAGIDGDVPAAEWDLLPLLPLECDVRRLVALLLRALGAGGKEPAAMEEARGFCSGRVYGAGAVEDDCCCCCCW